MSRVPRENGQGRDGHWSQACLPFLSVPTARGEQHVKVQCCSCGRRFRVPTWYAEAKLRLRFCGRACREAWEREVDGQDRVRLGGRPARRGGNWAVQASRARGRDGYRCRVCGATEEDLGRQLDVHHVMPYRLLGSSPEANNLSNLISVCPSCHKKLEEEGRSRLPLLSSEHGPEP